MRRAVLLVVSMAIASVIAGGVALAALNEAPDPGTAEVNGRVWDVLRSGGRIYLAGAFTQVTNPDGTAVARNNLAAVDEVTGRVTSWNPSATNPSNPAKSSVRSMALSSDGARLLVGGSFTRVGGKARARLAAVDPLTGTVDPDWKADADRPVYALAASGNKLYAGGAFSTVSGQPRERLAAVNQTTGALDPNWKPTAYRGDGGIANVRAIDTMLDTSSATPRTRVYVGGTFNRVSGTRTLKLAALDGNTGAVLSGFKPATGNDIFAMAIANGRVFVGAGDPLEGIEAFDVATGQLVWSVPGGHPEPEAGDVQAIVVSRDGETVYAGGHFAQMGGLVRKRLLELDADTGQIGPWAPAIPGFQSGNLGVWALEVDPTGRLYAGGDFTQVEGREYLRFARFSGL